MSSQSYVLKESVAELAPKYDPDNPFTKLGVIFHVSHDATFIPDNVRSQFLLDDSRLEFELLQMTDHLTYDLICVCAPPANIVRAPVSRLVVDVERFTSDELEPMSAIGMGAIYRMRYDSQPLRRSLTSQEQQSLYEDWYLPHHERLTQAVAKTLAVNGRALVIDVHSYPRQALPYKQVQDALRPEIRIESDPQHTPKQLEDLAQQVFKDAGFDVALNTPFSGALVPGKHYGKDQRVSAIMLEIRRDLYLIKGQAKPAEIMLNSNQR